MKFSTGPCFHWWQQLPLTILATTVKEATLSVSGFVFKQLGLLSPSSGLRKELSAPQRINLPALSEGMFKRNEKKLFLCAQLKLLNSLASKTQACKKVGSKGELNPQRTGLQHLNTMVEVTFSLGVGNSRVHIKGNIRRDWNDTHRIKI